MSHKKLVITPENNGLTLIGEKFKAQSGFQYGSGYREFGDLKIIEDVAIGAGVAFLAGIKVLDKEGVLIIDKKIKKGCHYEREVARSIVLEELLKMLIEANTNNPIDLENIRKKISEQLLTAYYKTSYKSILAWAKNLGIL